VQSEDKVICPGRAARPGLMGLAFALACLLAVGARAQGVRYDNIVLGPRGTPVAAAQIAVCTAAAVRTTAPCSPLAQIYSDQALSQPLANPFQADSLGNYGFWAQPGHYVVQLYGTGLTTRAMDVFLACDPSNCSMTSATFSSITAGTLNLTGSLTVNGRSVATEPAPNDAVQYVSPSGNDSSDGLSWGTAKQTIYAAWNTLYAINGGSPSYVNGNGGTIYVAANASCGGPVAGQGLWIMGSSDPNWNGGSVPTGWVKDMPVRIVGVGTNSWISNAPGPSVLVNCGSGASANLPSLWISGTGAPKQFDNLDFQGASGGAYQSMRIGIDSNGVYNTNSGAVGLTFNNDQFDPSSNAGGGPTVDIGSNVFNIWFNNDMIQADTAAPGGTDQHQAMVINGGGGNCTQPGLIFIRNMHLNAGNLKYHTESCQNGGSIYINGLVTENQNDGHGAVELTEESPYGIYSIQNVIVADANPSSPSVEVDQASPGTLQNTDALPSGGNPSAPGYINGGESGYYGPNDAEEPSATSNYGFRYGKVWGQSDAARRLFGLTESPWPNIAHFLPSSWTNATETAVVDPTGSTFAGQSTGSPYFYDATGSYAAGDFIIAGGWYRVPSKTGISGLNPFGIAFWGGGGCQMQPLDKSSAPNNGESFGLESYAGDGQWTWASAAFVVTTGGASCELRFQANMHNATTGLIYYAPVLDHIPATAVASYSEAADLAMTLAPYPSTLSGLADSTLPGHPIAFGGSGDSYLATIDHSALTSNQTYTLPASGGTVGVAVGQATVSGPTATISAGACAATVTTAVAGVTTGMTILATPSADPAAAGYKSLTVYWFPTAGNVNLEVCNPSSSSVTPGALGFNVRAIE